ncbi:MAG: chorismate synthase [Oscillospiraceae bacterium]
MKSCFGNSIVISLFGESHSSHLGVVITGLPSGLKIDKNHIDFCLNMRKPKKNISTARVEKDEYIFASGFFNDRTTGTPLCILMENKNINSSDYELLKNTPRPSHADFTANQKYFGFQDYRGGGHFSGRLTAPIVVAGAICSQLLMQKGIKIRTHIYSTMDIFDTPFDYINPQEVSYGDLALIDKSKENTIKDKICELNGNSIGGILESAIIGMPCGIGEPFFDSIESVISSLIYSIPAVKGVEFGLGFDFATKKGSEVNDELIDFAKTSTNFNGGINGGISNGMPIIVRTVIKPTPSISFTQNTIDLKDNSPAKINIKGRHDPAIFNRAPIILDSMIAIGVLDLICQRYGYTYFNEV